MTMMDILMQASIPQLIVLFITIVWFLWLASLLSRFVNAIDTWAVSRDRQSRVYDRWVTHKIDMERRRYHDNYDSDNEYE